MYMYFKYELRNTSETALALLKYQEVLFNALTGNEIPNT